MAKKHLALLVPHTDTTLETDLQYFLSDSWVYHSCRMFLEEVGEEAEKRMVDEDMPKALATLKGIIPFDAVIFGCTSASAVYGKEGLERLHHTMEQVMGCPAYSAFGGVLDRIEQAGNPPLALMTPYIPEVNRFFIQTLESFGIQTVFHAGLGILEDPQIAAVPLPDILEFARQNCRQIRDSGAGMVLFSCTNIRAFHVRDQLEEILGIPVITSNQCMVEWLRGLCQDKR